MSLKLERYSEIFGLSHNLEMTKKSYFKNLEFLKSKISLEDIILTDNYDIIFYDAFAPSKQPSMWEEKYRKIYSNMNYDSVVTYCSVDNSRDLKSMVLKLMSYQDLKERRRWLEQLNKSTLLYNSIFSISSSSKITIP